MSDAKEDDRSERERLREWLTSRFDRVDSRTAELHKELLLEIRDTRHKLKDEQEKQRRDLEKLTYIANSHNLRLDSIENWKGDNGPLDRKHGQLDERLKKLEDAQAREEAQRGRIPWTSISSAILTAAAVSGLMSAWGQELIRP